MSGPLALSAPRRLAYAALAAAAALLTACAPLTPNMPKNIAHTETDRNALMALLQDSAAAWNRGDLKGHLAIYDASVTVMTKTGPRPTVEAIEESFGKTYFVNGQPKQQLRMDSVVVRSLSADAALMTGRFVLQGGGQAEQSGWFTLVWVRTAQGWRAVHDHTS